MKRTILVAFLLFLHAPLGAGDIFVDFANRDYHAVEETLLREQTTRPHDPLIAYNLGVTAEKRDRRGQALYWYLQALQAAPELPEARHNLTTLAAELSVDIPRILTDPPHDNAPFMALFLLFLYLFVALLLFQLFRPDWRARLALLPTILFAALFAALFLHRYHEDRGRLYGVAIAAAELRSGPDAMLTAVGKVREGEVLSIGTVSGEWLKIKSFQDNIEGWIHGGEVRHIVRRIE